MDRLHKLLYLKIDRDWLYSIKVFWHSLLIVLLNVDDSIGVLVITYFN
jgi:hypothetical protein